MAVRLLMKRSPSAGWPAAGQLKYGELGVNTTAGSIWIGSMTGTSGPLTVINVTTSGVGSLQGPTGPVGPVGPAGLVGPTTTGSQGPQGAQGPRGINGG